MQYKSFGQIKIKVQRELDIEVEEFIQPEEFVEYVNDGISNCESLIHTLGLENLYFRTRALISLVTGQEDYSLPAAIYMNKILSFMYSNNSTIYEIKQLRGPDMYEYIAFANAVPSSTDYYRYLIRNDNAVDGVKVQFVPKSREDSANVATMWFIRETAKWSYATDPTGALLCDLPQISMQYLYQYVKYRCYEKEGHANMTDAKADLAVIEKNMIATMESMIPDMNTEVVKDLSSYEEMS